MSEIYSYKTIAQKATSVLREKASKFIGIAFPAGTHDEIAQILDQLKKEYYDASHICYAYRLGFKGDNFRTYDDGEPSGTAGKPILGQIDSLDLTNILVVSVRYFGGTKLGTGGLIQAYRESARTALENAFITEQELMQAFSVEMEYAGYSGFMQLLNTFKHVLEKEEHGEKYSAVFRIPLRSVKDFLDKTERANFAPEML